MSGSRAAVKFGIHPHPGRDSRGRRIQPLTEEHGRLFERPVLQESCEQEIARLEELEVFFVLFDVAREEPGRFQVEQDCSHDQELRRLVQVPRVALTAQVGHEVVGHLMQGQGRDLQLVLGDQRQQQVERAGELLQADLERSLRGPGRPRQGSSVTGSSAMGTATSVGGNDTVRR